MEPFHFATVIAIDLRGKPALTTSLRRSMQTQVRRPWSSSAEGGVKRDLPAETAANAHGPWRLSSGAAGRTFVFMLLRARLIERYCCGSNRRED